MLLGGSGTTFERKQENTPLNGFFSFLLAVHITFEPEKAIYEVKVGKPASGDKKEKSDYQHTCLCYEFGATIGLS